MWRAAGHAGSVGLEILLGLAVGYYGGRWLDGKLGTAPWLGWVGIVVGIGVAIKALMRVTKDYKKSLDDGPPDGSPKN
jgi:F0F1-type ATP synthase assembly protein I